MRRVKPVHVIHAQSKQRAEVCVFECVCDEIVYFCAHNCFTDFSYLYVQRVIYNDALSLSLSFKSDLSLTLEYDEMMFLSVVSLSIKPCNWRCIQTRR